MSPIYIFTLLWILFLKGDRCCDVGMSSPSGLTSVFNEGRAEVDGMFRKTEIKTYEEADIIFVYYSKQKNDDKRLH